MSRPHAKASNPTAQEAPAQAPDTATDSATGSAAAALVPATPPAAPPRDAYHGRGGLFTMKNGRRVPVPAPTATPATAKEPQ